MPLSPQIHLRNVAIIAHGDLGKPPVDAMLSFSTSWKKTASPAS